MLCTRGGVGGGNLDVKSGTRVVTFMALELVDA